jgi:hypothetical protein
MIFPLPYGNATLQQRDKSRAAAAVKRLAALSGIKTVFPGGGWPAAQQRRRRVTPSGRLVMKLRNL